MKRFLSDPMHILLLHGWLRGNLGDACMTDQLLQYLRRRFANAHITLVSEPRGQWTIPADLLSRVDTFIEQPYRDPVDELIATADAVINVPGGGLQDPADARGAFMLRDAELCHRLGIFHAFVGHSFHASFDLPALQGSFILAREPASHALLASRGISAHLSADPAFLLSAPSAASACSGTALFLRRWHFQEVAKHDKTLMMDDRTVKYEHEPLILASSDPLRDDSVLAPFAAQHALRYERCFDLSHLLRVIGSAEHVISDRYHPVIFAAMLGVPFTFLQRKGSLRDEGLSIFLREKSIAELRELSAAGFGMMCDVMAG